MGPASIAIINRLFPRERRVQAMGYWSMVGAGGPVIGVVAGGPIVETFGWRWIFVAQVPLTFTGLCSRSSSSPRPSGAAARASTSPAPAILAVGATSLLFAINRGPSVGLVEPGDRRRVRAWRRWRSCAFVLVERRVAHPLLPLAYLRRRNFSFAIATQFFTNFAYMGGFVITPLFLESVFGYPETRVGALMIARPLAFADRPVRRRLRRDPGGGARVGGGRRRCSWWRRWSRCPPSRRARPTS